MQSRTEVTTTVESKITIIDWLKTLAVGGRFTVRLVSSFTGVDWTALWYRYNKQHIFLFGQFKSMYSEDHPYSKPHPDGKVFCGWTQGLTNRIWIVPWGGKIRSPRSWPRSSRGSPSGWTRSGRAGQFFPDKACPFPPNGTALYPALISPESARNVLPRCSNWSPKFVFANYPALASSLLLSPFQPCPILNLTRGPFPERNLPVRE